MSESPIRGEEAPHGASPGDTAPGDTAHDHAAPDYLEVRPRDARAFLVLSHGSGAGMRHAFMEGLARALADRGVATLRWEFPYMRAGKPFPDPPATLVASVRRAVAEGRRRAGGLPLYAGGKSLGGRMTSTAQAEAPLHGVEGVVLFGFPLHPARKPGRTRGDHLSRVALPMLFLQGTRDRLAELGLLDEVVGGLGSRARLHVVEGADHGFHVLKRSGRTDEEVLAELADTAARWMDGAPSR